MDRVLFFFVPNIWGGTGSTISAIDGLPNGAFGENRGSYKKYGFGDGSAYLVAPFLDATLSSTIYKTGFHSVQPESLRIYFIVKF